MEEDEHRRGEEMGLTVRQRQAVMNELRAKYAHASKKEKSKILDGFVDLTHLNRSYARSVLRAGGVRVKNHIHRPRAVSYTHLRAHETRHDLVCRLLLEKKKKKQTTN